MDITKADIFMTGGAGTLGRAIARRRAEKGWSGRLTVYSTDEHKHAFMRRLYPDVQYVQGDIRNPETLYLAMVGHDICLHLAATKVIPVSEYQSIDTIDVNIYGSQVVAQTCVRANIEHALAISTDKACHPHNLYGATKMAMEKVWQEYARAGFDTQFHLVRYGNVLESTGSVVEFWKQSVQRGEPIKITEPTMTRFWLSPQQAVDLVIDALEWNSGQVLIPMHPALSIGKLAEYSIGIGLDQDEGEAWPIEPIPLRPGEKMHETLLTVEELEYAMKGNYERIILGPTTGMKVPKEDRFELPYTSDTAIELTKEQLAELLDDRIPG